MKRVMVQYRVKLARAAENEQYIKQVFQALKASQPQDLRYAVFKGEDGVSFVHIAENAATDGSNQLATLAAFQEFRKGIEDRCEQKPIVTALDQVGSYRLSDG